jgi:hypothetical protein
MKTLTLVLGLLLPLAAMAQFSTVQENKLSIIVTDGTYDATHSPQRPPSNAKYQDPIRPLGMVDAIQAGAFTVRPQFGRAGFILIFCVNDSVGGKQGTYEVDGNTYYGIYRLIRQRIAIDEELPKGMTNYRIKGTVFFLGVS